MERLCHESLGTTQDTLANSPRAVLSHLLDPKIEGKLGPILGPRRSWDGFGCGHRSGLDATKAGKMQSLIALWPRFLLGQAGLRAVGDQGSAQVSGKMRTEHRSTLVPGLAWAFLNISDPSIKLSSWPFTARSNKRLYMETRLILE